MMTLPQMVDMMRDVHEALGREHRRTAIDGALRSLGVR